MSLSLYFILFLFFTRIYCSSFYLIECLRLWVNIYNKVKDKFTQKSVNISHKMICFTQVHFGPFVQINNSLLSSIVVFPKSQTTKDIIDIYNPMITYKTVDVFLFKIKVIPNSKEYIVLLCILHILSNSVVFNYCKHTLVTYDAYIYINAIKYARVEDMRN